MSFSAHPCRERRKMSLLCRIFEVCHVVFATFLFLLRLCEALTATHCRSNDAYLLCVPGPNCMQSGGCLASCWPCVGHLSRHTGASRAAVARFWLFICHQLPLRIWDRVGPPGKT